MSTCKIATGLVLSWLLLSGGPIRAAVQPEDIQKLVAKLGSEKKDEAANAHKELVGIGLPALAPLRNVAFENKGKPAGQSAEAVLKEIVQNAQKLLEARLVKLKAVKPIVRPIIDEQVARVFPSDLVFSVRFPRYPSQVQPPAALKPNNLFIMDKDGQMTPLNDFLALDNFFRDTIRQAFKDERIKVIGQAWLLMWKEFHQDGYFQFVLPEKAVEVKLAMGGPRAMGRIIVKKENGNDGYLQAALIFGVNGDLEFVRIERHLKFGPRPGQEGGK